MVAEPAEATPTTEQEVIQPEAELTQAEEPTPSAPDTAPSDDGPDEDLNAFLKEKGIVTEEAVDQDEEVTAARPDAWIEELPEEHREKAKSALAEANEALERERQAKEAAKRQRTEQEVKDLQAHYGRLEGAFQAFERGEITDARLKEYTSGLFKSFSDRAARLAESTVGETERNKAIAETVDKTATAYVENFLAATDAHLPSSQAKAFRKAVTEGKLADVKEAVGDLVKRVRDAAYAEGAGDYHKGLLEKPEKLEALRSRAKAPELNGSGVSSGVKSAEWLNNLPPEEYEKVPVEERRRIWAQTGKG